MHVISKKKLKNFWEHHPESRKPLEVWFKVVRSSRYHTFHELRMTFPKADKVGDKIVFNIGGNTYRLITVIHFNRFKVYVRDVLTHEEYDKGVWKNG
ncbi:MAG: type II toxin-antitoxin system HigB family toxin [Candidatus Omnitrophica bacterium]|nr:type II toxin-antitoxin system HigB family toxin [Candidatus Omnitrophota bacterium]